MVTRIAYRSRPVWRLQASPVVSSNDEQFGKDRGKADALQARSRLRAQAELRRAVRTIVHVELRTLSPARIPVIRVNR
jgi:hypothetical protein